MDDFSMNEATQNINRTVIAPAVGAEATLLGTTVKCPVCATENAPNEKYCGECGFLLASTPGEAAPEVDTSQMLKLVDPAGQREYFLHQGENSVGRESADILLADPTVSRRHALVVVDGGKVWVEDQGSTNGTIVDGKPSKSGERIEAVDGAEVKFGSAVLRIAMPEGSIVEASEPSTEDAPEVTAESIADELPVESVPEEAPIEEVAPVSRLVSATDPSVSFTLVNGTNTIGRRSGNDIVLSGDSYVSGAHAELIVDERGYWLVDIGSTNGTMLNGTKIQSNSRMALDNGAEIVFGQTALRLDIPELQEQAEEATEISEQPEEEAGNYGTGNQ